MSLRDDRKDADRRIRAAARGSAPTLVETTAHKPGGTSGTAHATHPGLRDRGVVVTGGASGIGRAIALAFAAAGARVTILDFDAKHGRATLAELRRHDPSARFVALDLRRNEDVREVAAEIFRGPRGPDILINNASITGPIRPFPLIKPADLESVLRTNVMGPYLLSQAAARFMIAQGRGGTIINVHAIQTAIPVPGHTAYIASKGAIDGLTLALAVDLAPHGIRVNGIEVGCVMTEGFHAAMAARLKRGGQRAPSGEAMDKFLDGRTATLLNRMGRPEEIARVALFLAADDASFVTGSIIRADGGRSISRKTEPLL